MSIESCFFFGDIKSSGLEQLFTRNHLRSLVVKCGMTPSDTAFYTPAEHILKAHLDM